MSSEAALVDVAALARKWLEARGGDGETFHQSTIAKRTGLTNSAISEIFRGSRANPRWQTLRRLIVGMKLTPAQFFAGPGHIVVPESDNSHQVYKSRIDVKGAPVAQTALREIPNASPSADLLTATELRTVTADLRESVHALNHIVTQLVVNEDRKEASSPRSDRPRSRANSRKHRR